MFGSLKNPGIVIRSLDSIFNSLEYLLAPKYCIKSDGSNSFNVQSETEAIQMKQRLDYNENMRSTKYASRYADREVEGTRHIVCKGYRYAVFVSFYEVYNNSFVDLLSPSTNNSAKVKLSIREDFNRSVYVSGLTEVEIRSTEEGMHLLEIGRKRRHTAGTNLNHDSSRSHSIFCLKLVRCNVDSRYDEVNASNPDIKISQLCLVDLAGSERTNRALTKGDRLKEASSINNTLMTLRKCIDVLRFNQKCARNSPPLSASLSSLDSSGIASNASNTGKGTFANNNLKIVPYRDSKLTHIFKSFFEGDGIVRMIVCIKPLAKESDELAHVLNFAEATQTVSTVRYIQESTPPEYSVSLSDIRESNVPLSVKKTSFIRSIASKIGHWSASHTNQEKSIYDRCDALEAKSLKHMKFLEEKIAIIEKESNEFLDYMEKEEEETLEDEDLENFDQKYLKNLCSNELIRYFESNGEADILLKELLDTQSYINEYARHKVVGYVTDMMEKQSATVSADLKKKNFIEKNKIIEPKSRKIEQKGFVNSISRQFESKLAGQKRPSPFTPTVVQLATPRESRINTMYSTSRKVHANTRYNKDTGDNSKWLEHIDNNSTPLGTVFKAKLRRSRSTSRPNLKDTLDATNYLLHHQECTPTGDIHTRLYKGDIIPTAGGGASIIFNDVEELRQFSPGKESPCVK